MDCLVLLHTPTWEARNMVKEENEAERIRIEDIARQERLLH